MSDISRLGRYLIRREIARSNDIVYEATDSLIGRRVALKELSLPSNLVGQGKRERIERFYREARAAGSLAHKNIVTVFEVGEEEGRHFIAMEFLEGQTLRQTLDLNGSLPLPQIQDILLQTLEALAYAHANGIVHRDIKPDNLYILPDGTVKLTDFGIARIMDEPSLTGAGQVFGTPSYMSPEQIAGKPVDERTDLYSLGVMAYEMTAGRKPFVGENVVALTYQILNIEPEPPRGADAEFASIIRKAMAKDPAQRYQSARQMADALRNRSGGITQGFGANATGSFNAGFNGASTNPTILNAPIPGAQFSTTPSPNLSTTIPPGLPRRRTLSREMRRFLVALTVGALSTILIAGVYLGARAAYKSYSDSAKEQAALTVYQKGASSYKSQNFPEAIRYFKRVIERAGGTPLAKDAAHAIVQSWLNLGDAVININVQQAYDDYNTSLRYEPNNPEIYLRLGDALERQGHFDDSIRLLKRAQNLGGFGDAGLMARREQSRIWYNRAVGEFNAGNHDIAREDWHQAMEADPGGFFSEKAEDQIRTNYPQAFPGY